MPVGRPSAERFEEVRRIIEEHHTAPEPKVVNSTEAASMDSPAYRHFRGVVYKVEPIPAPMGLKMVNLVREYGEAIEKGDVDIMKSCLQGFVDLFYKLAVPLGWRRIFYPILPNPFRKASERQVMALVDFFWTYRTGESIHKLADRVEKRGSSLTGSPTGTSSNGSTNGSPQPGGITSGG